MKLNMRKAAVATASVAAAGGLVFGATEAFAASPAASTSSTPSAGASATATPGRHACAAAKQSTTTKQGKQARPGKHARACVGGGRGAAGRGREQVLKNGAHGQKTVKNKTGAYLVEEWQVGKVGSISGGSITVTDGSGTTWTWSVQSATKFMVDGKKGALSGVHVGDTIMVRGTQSGSANDVTALLDPDQSKVG